MNDDFHYDQGTSLEGAGTNMKFRRFHPGPPEKNKKLKEEIFPFVIEQSAEVSIVKELSPKRPKISKNSLLSKGDGIRGDKISGLSEKPVRRPEVRPDSSSHRAQYLNIRCYTFAEIERPYEYLLE